MPRKTVLALGTILVAIPAILIAGGVYLETENGQRLLREKINTMIPGRLSWQKCSFSLLTGSFSLESLHFTGPDNDELAEVERIFLDISWKSLIKGELRLESALIERPRLMVDSANNLNIIKALSAPPPAKNEEKAPETQAAFMGNFLIDDFRITDVGLQYETPGPGPGAAPRLPLDSRLALLEIKGEIFDLLSSPILNLTAELHGELGNLGKFIGTIPEITGPMVIRLDLHGKLENPAAELTLAYKNGLLAGNRLDEVTMDIRLRDRLITIATLEAASPLGQVRGKGQIDLTRVFKSGFLSSPADLDAVSYAISCRLIDLLLDKLPNTAAGLSGRVNADLTLEGSGISIEKIAAAAMLEASAVSLRAGPAHSPVSADLKASFAIKNKVAAIRELDLAGLAAKLQARGEYDLSLKKINAELALTATDLEALFSPFGVKNFTGAIKGNAHVAGAIAKPGAELSLNGENLAFEEINIGMVTIDSSLEESGIVNIRALKIENSGSVIEAKGTLGLFKEGFALSRDLPSDFSMTFRDLEGDDFFGDIGVKGCGNGSLRWRGSLAFPEADLKLRVKSLARGKLTVGDLDTELELSGGTVKLKRFRVHNGHSALALSGTVQALDPRSGKLLADPLIRLNLASDGIFLEDFIPELHGRFTVKGNVNGSLKAPTGLVQVTGSGIDLGVQQIDNMRLAATLDGEKIHLNPLSVCLNPNEEIRGEGWVRPLDGEYDLRIAAKGLALAGIGALKELDLASGSITLDLTGRGRLDNPACSGDVQVTELFLKGIKTDDMVLHADLRDGIAVISGTFHAAINAVYEFESKRFKAHALFADCDLTPFLVWAGNDELSGSLSGELQAEGEVDTPGMVRAQADISALTIFRDKTEIIRSLAFKAAFKDRRLSIPGINLAFLEQGHLDIRGNAELDGVLDLSADGNIPLAVAAPFFEEIDDLAGTVEFSATIKGPRVRPDLAVDLKLREIEMTVPGLDQKLHNLTGELHLTPSGVKPSSLRGHLDSGWFELSGESALQDFRPTDINLQLKAEKIPIALPDTADLVFNSDFALHGSFGNAFISGEIVLLEGLYYKDVKINILEAMQEKQRDEKPAGAEPAKGYLRDIALDIDIRHRGPIHVDNNIALIDIKPILHLYGNPDNPLLRGRAVVDKGTLIYQNKEFAVTMGIIDFLNPYKIEPTIDIKSRTQIREWTIFLEISGTSENLIFKLASSPREEHGDILSLIMFGKTTRELIRSEGGMGTSPMQIVADIVAGDLQENIMGATGFDMVEIKYRENGTESDMATVDVTIGKELSRRLMIKYGVETGRGETRQKASAEYKILEGILANYFRNTAGVFGGEIVYRLEFR